MVDNGRKGMARALFLSASAVLRLCLLALQTQAYGGALADEESAAEQLDALGRWLDGELAIAVAEASS